MHSEQFRGFNRVFEVSRDLGGFTGFERVSHIAKTFQDVQWDFWRFQQFPRRIQRVS